MAKPTMEDEEDALSMVLSDPMGEEAGEESEEAPESESSQSADQVLDDISAKLEQLRGLVSQV